MSGGRDVELKEVLERLRAEVDTLGVDENEAKNLTELISEIDAKVDSGEPLSERVKHYLEKFEVEHPRVTAILNELLVTLSNMGI